jgi:hypothetical protein
MEMAPSNSSPSGAARGRTRVGGQEVTAADAAPEAPRVTEGLLAKPPTGAAKRLAERFEDDRITLQPQIEWCRIQPNGDLHQPCHASRPHGRYLPPPLPSLGESSDDRSWDDRSSLLQCRCCGCREGAGERRRVSTKRRLRSIAAVEAIVAADGCLCIETGLLLLVPPVPLLLGLRRKQAPWTGTQVVRGQGQ